jgi:hypothetical protein
LWFQLVRFDGRFNVAAARWPSNALFYKVAPVAVALASQAKVLTDSRFGLESSSNR